MKRCNIYLVNHMISVNAGENAITQKAMFNIYIDENFYIEECSPSYVIRTSLSNGRIGMIVDPGSVWDLAGSEWAKQVAKRAHSAGLQPSYGRRAVPLSISGVGNGSQQCPYDCQLPIALKNTRGERRT